MNRSRNIVLSGLACGAVAAIIIACGSEGDSTFDENGSTSSSSGSIFDDAGFDPDSPSQNPDLFAKDPPPKWCGPDSGTPLPQPQGTEQCPDDKNLPGCGCDRIGDTAKCWTGFRKDRHLGDCKDGTTTCRGKNETTNVWGKCEGQVLPTPGATGAAACSCFSAGVWFIANLAPCLREQGGTYWSHSTVPGHPTAYCSNAEPVAAGATPPTSVAPGYWSTNTLKVDCAGTFNLTYRIRQGDFKNPKSTDCVLGKVDTVADYIEADKVQTLPPLSHWAGGTTAEAQACAKKWEKDTPSDQSPGYGEMVVKGQTVQCDEIDDGAGNEFVFHRVQYCARICRPTNPAEQGGYQPNAEVCKTCQLSGQGEF